MAIKNGMHQEEGFAFFTSGAAQHAPADRAHVAELSTTIKKYFGLDSLVLSEKNYTL